jgi:hypothetical protein
MGISDCQSVADVNGTTECKYYYDCIVRKLMALDQQDRLMELNGIALPVTYICSLGTLVVEIDGSYAFDDQKKWTGPNGSGIGCL